ncbi:hypothetical protein [Rhizobium bangladeshense]|uniref:hypothetical protein n=1 Tax=Rhizobium bangladeshense TaxID=1138189 RepID=UPI0009EDD65B|nr:hypothetical protein [Rhizobium bangladeshense]
MTADWRKKAGTIAVLTFVVVLAGVFAPVPGVQGMQCHEHPTHDQSGVAHALALRGDLHAAQCGFHSFNHVACCAVQCNVCVFTLSIDDTEAPAAIGSFLHFVWGDQTGRGLALPPTLGPPRLPT